MELTYDWRGFQGFYYPKKRMVQAEQKAVQPIYLVIDKGMIISAYGDHEDLSEWLGSPVEDVVTHFGHQDCVVFDRSQMDEWLQGCQSQPHYYEQMSKVREKAESGAIIFGRSGSKAKKTMRDLGERTFREHFLLQGIRTWWKKLFPSEFGLYVRLEGKTPRGFLVIFRKGLPLSFFEPDLTGMGKERREIPAEIVKFLSEKHLVPVQGMSVAAEVWDLWHTSPDPWRQMLRALRNRSLKLIPFRWDLVSLIAMRSYFGL